MAYKGWGLSPCGAYDVAQEVRAQVLAGELRNEEKHELGGQELALEVGKSRGVPHQGGAQQGERHARDDRQPPLVREHGAAIQAAAIQSAGLADHDVAQAQKHLHDDKSARAIARVRKRVKVMMVQHEKYYLMAEEDDVNE